MKTDAVTVAKFSRIIESKISRDRSQRREIQNYKPKFSVVLVHQLVRVPDAAELRRTVHIILILY